MKCSMMLRHIWGPVKWVLTRSITLICVSYLLAADVKRVPQDEALKAVTASAAREKFAALGMETVARTPDEFAAVIRAETPVWAKLIKQIGIAPIQ